MRFVRNLKLRAPNLQTVSINGRIGDSKSALGTIAFKDQNGYHSQSGAYVTYAHHIMFSRRCWRGSKKLNRKIFKLWKRGYIRSQKREK